MKIIGVRQLAISKLKLPGDMKARVASQRVRARAESIAKVGLLYEVYVRKPSMELLAGADRVAAHMVLERDTIPAKLVECSDDEAEIITATENAHRRHEPLQAEESMSALVAKMAQSVVVPHEEVVRAGRPLTRKGAAIQQLAAERGVKPNSIRIQMYRERKRKQREAAAAAMDSDEPPVLVFGMNVSTAFLALVVRLQQDSDAIDMKLRTVSREITRLSELDLAKEAPLSKLHEQLTETAATIRDLRPAALCPYCKGLEAVQANCVPCMGKGYVGRRDLVNVPKDLMDPEHPRVSYQGQIISAWDLRPEKAEPEEAAPSSPKGGWELDE